MNSKYTALKVRLRSINVPLRNGAGYSNAIAKMAIINARICTRGILTITARIGASAAAGL